MSNPATEDILGMSDDEFLKRDPSTFEKPADETAGTANTGSADDAGADDSGETDDDNKGTTDDEGIAVVVPDKVVAPKDVVVAEGEVDKQPAATVVTDEQPKPAAVADMTDEQYVNIGKQIMSEFKANGTNIKVKNVEDAIQLMQMGANYHKKMAGLKPSLKTLKLLENNGLLDPDKLNYLIDLSQKKPEAITQLLKDSKIDPMNIDLTEGNEYVPQKRSVSDTEILLDEVLESISHSPAYNKTLTVLGDEWDADSRSLLAKTPEVIRTINAHMENGIYDQVNQAVQYERSLGKLVGISDYEAYQRVGSYMHENNLFVSASGQPAVMAPNSQPTNTQARDTAAAAAEAARIAAKKAASPSRTGKTAVDNKADYNPLSMSDEDFIKLNKLHI